LSVNALTDARRTEEGRIFNVCRRLVVNKPPAGRIAHRVVQPHCALTVGDWCGGGTSVQMHHEQTVR